MSGPQDVVFLVIDSARKDRLSAFGHDRQTTPTFDALAADATVYENAFTPAPWTLPSHCSMFTGTFPSEHGVTNGFTDGNLALPAAIDTIPEILADRGVATAGFSNNPWVGKLSGLNRGFDRFVEWDLEISHSEGDADHRTRDVLYSRLHTLMGRAAGQPHAVLKRRFFTANLIERANRWLRETAARRSFTFMNVMEAHSPYYPPKRAFRALDLDHPGMIESRTINAKLLAYILGKAELAPETRERVMEFYDASLRFQDEQLATLLEVLRSQGRYDDALIAICADHGKTLGDVDRDATPPHYVRDINVNVPMLIKWPGQTGGERVEAPVELADLFEVLTDPEGARSLPTRPEGALVEDHVPHTARHATDVVRWRVLADESTKYVESDDDRKFLLNRGEEESLLDASTSELRPYRDRLQDRVEALQAPAAGTDAESGGSEMTAGVEGQLEDLGYLS